MGCLKISYQSKITVIDEKQIFVDFGYKKNVRTKNNCSNYYSFGMLQPNRHGEEYRYGYQGSEMDNETKGKGNSYTTHFRQLDPRLGRWLSIDPKTSELPWESPYVSMGSNPVSYNDILGDKYTPQAEGTVNLYRANLKLKKKEIKSYLRSMRKRGLKSMSRLNPSNGHHIVLTRESLKARKADVNQMLKETRILEKSDQMYDIKLGKSLRDGIGAKSGFDINTGYMVMHLNTNSTNFNDYKGALADEMTHAYQFETGQLSFMLLPGAEIHGIQVGGDLFDQIDEKQSVTRAAFMQSVFYDAQSAQNTPYVNSLPKNSIGLKTQKSETQTWGDYLISRIKKLSDPRSTSIDVFIGWEKYTTLEEMQNVKNHTIQGRTKKKLNN